MPKSVTMMMSECTIVGQCTMGADKHVDSRYHVDQHVMNTFAPGVSNCTPTEWVHICSASSPSIELSNLEMGVQNHGATVNYLESQVDVSCFQTWVHQVEGGPKHGVHGQEVMLHALLFAGLCPLNEDRPRKSRVAKICKDETLTYGGFRDGTGTPR